MDDVETTVETTTETTPSVVEENTNEPQEAPVVESNDTEEKVSKEVFLERLNKEIEKRKGLEEKLNAVLSQNQPQPQYQEVPDLDPDSAAAVDRRAQAIFEARENQKFEAKHAADFGKDPLLRASYMLEAQKMMAQGQYVDRDAALEQAKAALDARLQKPVQEAKQAGVQEGQDIAKTKQQLGAIGDTAKPVEVDDSQLTAAELAKKYNIPRTVGY